MQESFLEKGSEEVKIFLVDLCGRRVFLLLDGPHYVLSNAST